MIFRGLPPIWGPNCFSRVSLPIHGPSPFHDNFSGVFSGRRNPGLLLETRLFPFPGAAGVPHPSGPGGGGACDHRSGFCRRHLSGDRVDHCGSDFSGFRQNLAFPSAGSFGSPACPWKLLDGERPDRAISQIQCLCPDGTGDSGTDTGAGPAGENRRAGVPSGYPQGLSRTPRHRQPPQQHVLLLSPVVRDGVSVCHDLRGGIAPALCGLGMAFLLLMGLGVYFRQYLSPRLAWFVPVLFFSTPTFFEISASAYIDLALAGFMFFTFYAWDRWRETRLPFWFFYMACSPARPGPPN